MKKTIQMTLALVMLISSMCVAKTDLVTSVYYGDQFMVVDAGVVPVERLECGFRYAAGLAEVEENYLKIKDHYLGVFVKYPFLTFDSIFEMVPIEGQAFAGGALLWNPNDGDEGPDGDLIELVAMPEIGVDVKITDNISGRVSWMYTDREHVFEDSIVMAGFVARTK